MSNETIFDNIDLGLLKKFETYHRNNPSVFETFKALAFQMQRTGRKRYSAWAIINKIRWDYDLKTHGDEFKISNDYIALYARLLIYRHPEFEPFFELKRMKTDLNWTPADAMEIGFSWETFFEVMRGR